MKYVDEFRDKNLIGALALEINRAVMPLCRYNIMEVCGTHTMNIFRFGLRDILPENIRLSSGPGCPVCVTPNDFIDKAISLAGMNDIIIATFGDMLKVPGSRSSLEKERAKGAQVRIVYSTMDALALAKKNPAKEVVFLGIGFETTAPTVAQSILSAKKEGVGNYSVLCGHKTMPNALKALASDDAILIDGFLLPGHVSAVIGIRPYEFLSKRYKKRCVVSGFEPLDIMQAILMLVRQANPKVEIQYTRIIDKAGNTLAQRCIKKVFDATDAVWRGMGIIAKSGLKIKDDLRDFDAEAKFCPKAGPSKENKSCICGSVLKGIRTPPECKLFKKVCRPENPIGSCMVSSEGACAAYYRYG